MLTATEARKLKRRLPKGYQRICRQQLKQKYSLSYIGYVANGRRSSEEVLLALLDIAEKHEARQQELKRRLAQAA